VLYVDSSCKRQETDETFCVCSDTYFRYIGTPLSLVWRAGVRIEDQLELVKFPLDPAHPDRWYEWRGSSDTPLLVWDPAHTGEITRASQLFGNHTFGRRWKHGYEALATLDVDRSGGVSGDELAPLGLWFDANKNGVSEKGEVRPLTETGVTALQYGPVEDRTLVASLLNVLPEAGRMYVVERGYSRVEGGRVIELPSVDWIGQGYDSKLHAIGQQQ
jgi:hypothetical protein